MPETRTLSAAVREHLRQLCLQEFPCGTGSWVRALAGRPGEGSGTWETEGTDPGPGQGLGTQSGAGEGLAPVLRAPPAPGVG